MKREIDKRNNDVEEEVQKLLKILRNSPVREPRYDIDQLTLEQERETASTVEVLQKLCNNVK